MPVFSKTGKKITSPEGPLKGLSPEAVRENVVIFFEPNGNIFKPKGWIMAYFLDSPEAVEDFKSGKINYPMFVQGSFGMRLSGYAMIDAIWKRNSSAKDKEAEDKKKHVVGAVEAYMNIDGEPATPDDEGEKSIYIDNISVRPGWRRNSVASKLIKAIEMNWPNIPISDHSGTTDDGYKFLKQSGHLKHSKSDGDYERSSDEIEKLSRP